MEITIKKDGKVLVCILDFDAGYWSTVGVIEGMVSEFIERPESSLEEHDG